MGKGINRNSLTSYMQGVEDGQNQFKARVDNMRNELYKSMNAIRQFGNGYNLSESQRRQLGDIISLMSIAIQDDIDTEESYNRPDYNYDYSYDLDTIISEPRKYDPNDNYLVRVARGEEQVTPPENQPEPELPMDRYIKEPYIDENNNIVMPESDEDSMARNAIYSIMLRDK